MRERQQVLYYFVDDIGDEVDRTRSDCTYLFFRKTVLKERMFVGEDSYKYLNFIISIQNNKLYI